MFDTEVARKVVGGQGFLWRELCSETMPLYSPLRHEGELSVPLKTSEGAPTNHRRICSGPLHLKDKWLTPDKSQLSKAAGSDLL